MKLQFRSSLQIPVFRAAISDVDTMNDGDMQEIPDEIAKELLADYPKNFTQVHDVAAEPKVADYKNKATVTRHKRS